MKSTAVFCGSSTGNDNKMTSKAYVLGKTLALQKITLVYGAAKIGIMGIIANSALENGGTVIGVITDFLKTKEIASQTLTELIVTKNMHDRKVIVYDKSEGYIIIPGGFGTMDEFFKIST